MLFQRPLYNAMCTTFIQVDIKLEETKCKATTFNVNDTAHNICTLLYNYPLITLHQCKYMTCLRSK